MCLKNIFSILSCFLALAIFLRCNPSNTSASETLQSALDCHKALWQTHNPHNYQFRLTMTICAKCVPRGVAAVTIHADTIDAVVADSASYPPVLIQSVPTVDTLFVRIQNAIDHRYEKINITYDEIMGYPTVIDMDINTQVIGDESFYSVDSLHSVL
jgi:hypothetical protein